MFWKDIFSPIHLLEPFCGSFGRFGTPKPAHILPCGSESAVAKFISCRLEGIMTLGSGDAAMVAVVGGLPLAILRLGRGPIGPCLVCFPERVGWLAI